MRVSFFSVHKHREARGLTSIGKQNRGIGKGHLHNHSPWRSVWKKHNTLSLRRCEPRPPLSLLLLAPPSRPARTIPLTLLFSFFVVVARPINAACSGLVFLAVFGWPRCWVSFAYASFTTCNHQKRRTERDPETNEGEGTFLTRHASWSGPDKSRRNGDCRPDPPSVRARIPPKSTMPFVWEGGARERGHEGGGS